jgi:ABC-type uncharacterized transport system substrate-binding protein
VNRRECIGLVGGCGGPAARRPRAAAGDAVDRIPLSRIARRQNVAIEYRGVQHQYDRLPALAADLVRRQVGVIVVVSTPATLVAKAATNTIPIVFSMGADPVELSLITSLNRPGGNITGVYVLNAAVMGKRLELLRELVPASGVIALLHNGHRPSSKRISVRREIG